MMKVILEVLRGICPTDGIDLVREYIHIHQLCHYAAHTERTMGYLNSAIDTLWSVLKDPERLFVKLGLIPSQEYAPLRLHYLSHYVQSIRQFGILSGYSTQGTEIWHKPLKVAYGKSNKSTDCYPFILTFIARVTAFASKVSDLTDLSCMDDEPPGNEDSPEEEDTAFTMPPDERSAVIPPQEHSEHSEHSTPCVLTPSVQLSIQRQLAFAKRTRWGWPMTLRQTATELGLHHLEMAFMRMMIKVGTSSYSVPLIPLYPIAVHDSVRLIFP
jgi:hypothetical protein